MSDPMIVAAQEMLRTATDDLRPAVEDAPAAALNWKPGGDDTNSIAVLGVHVMHSTRMWLSVATGAALPDRNRDSEFVATTGSASELQGFIDDYAGQCDKLLQSAADVDWSAMRETHPRPRPGASQQVTSAWALLHAFEHLREHIGQMLLTRQLWERRGG